jgi:hypothetical protein
MKIFEDNYLKNEFINPKYVSTSREWEVEICLKGSKLDDLSDGQDILVSICKEFASTENGTVDFEYETIKIPEFKIEDIPEGELVWIGRKCRLTSDKLIIIWYLKQMKKDFIKESKVNYIVPYLIAETAEDAERLKGWSE